MRRRFLAALAASTLLMALCAPAALGQATAVDEGDDVQYNGVCQNIIGSIGDITAGNFGAATSTATSNANADGTADAPPADDEAAAGGGSPTAESQAEAVAEISQETGLSIEQVNECLNGADGNGTDDNGKNEEDDDDTDELQEGEDAVDDDTVAAVTELPNTGGPSLLAVGVGLALVAGGAALIRRR